MFSLFVFATLLTSVLSYQPPADFCTVVDPKCQKFLSRKHLHCGGTLKSSGNLGTTPTKMKLDEPMKQLILDSHNELRNTIACGEPKMVNLAGHIFPKAASLPKLMWDEELEWGAEQNAKTCAYGHDCMFTITYPMAGQNLGAKMTSASFEIKEIITEVVKHWWAEYINCPIEMIDSYDAKNQLVKPGKDFTAEEKSKVAMLLGEGSEISKTGHFTVVVREMSRVGCSLYSCGPANGMQNTYSLVCNYEKTNVMNQPVYKKSETSGSECAAKSKKYCCLCLDPADKETSSSCHKINFPLPSFPKVAGKTAGSQPAATGIESSTSKKTHCSNSIAISSNLGITLLIYLFFTLINFLIN